MCESQFPCMCEARLSLMWLPKTILSLSDVRISTCLHATAGKLIKCCATAPAGANDVSKLLTDRCHSHDSTCQLIWKLTGSRERRRKFTVVTLRRVQFKSNHTFVSEYDRTQCRGAEPSITGSETRSHRPIYLRVS
jgi:hypothetical protein